jgi:hypothetical protein
MSTAEMAAAAHRLMLAATNRDSEVNITKGANPSKIPIVQGSPLRPKCTPVVLTAGALLQLRDIPGNHFSR